MTGKPYEKCCQCNCVTGRAGRGDDSLYSLSGEVGPFCEDCFHEETCQACEGSGEVHLKRNRKGEVDHMDGVSTGETEICDSCKGEGIVIMTAEANTRWDYSSLIEGIACLENGIRQVQKNHFHLDPDLLHSRVGKLQHTIAFMEYNMKEVEIDGGNGDE